jgi:nucleoside-diphosphate-sugar epimerase
MTGVLVTGAGGFVGRHLCARLAQQGARVYGVLRPGRSPPIQGDHPVADWLIWDLAKEEAPRLPSGLTAVVHLAQSSRFREFPDQAADMFAVNVRATFGLLEAARQQGVPNFVYASTGGVYGHGPVPAQEQQPVNADTALGFYATSKLIGELLAGSFNDIITAAVLRLFFVYGPGQQADRLIPRLIDNVARGRAVTLEGDDGLTVNPVYVSDAVEAIVRSIGVRASCVFNIAGSEAITLRRLGALIGELIGREPCLELRPGRSSMLVGDVRSAQKQLGWMPSVSLKTGLARTVAAYHASLSGSG